MRVVLVPGTWGGEWCKPGSAFRAYLEARGFELEWFQGWSEAVDGLPSLSNIREGRKNSSWKAGGYSLRYLLEDSPIEDRNIIAHSHGGQIVLHCAGLAGLELNRVVTICTPVRADLEDIAVDARPRIRRHRQIAAKGWDFMMRAGELMDGHFGWSRKMPQAHENLFLEGIGHSGLLMEPKHFHYLEETVDGKIPTLDFLTEPELNFV